MLEANMKIEKREGVTYEPIKPGVYQVELLSVDIEDKPVYNNPSEMEKKFKFQFTFLAGELRAVRSIWANYVPVYLGISEKYGKNKLYKIIEALIGRELTQEEEAEMDGNFILSLVGKQCFIVVENTKKGDKTYNNIAAYSPSPILLASLTIEEKERAIVKKQESAPVADNTINDSDIPF